MLNQLLTEMDGMGSKKTVFIIGATNRWVRWFAKPCTSGAEKRQARVTVVYWSYRCNNE